MTSQPAGTDRCPKCGAAVRFGDPWCTLCYADLRPPPPPEPVVTAPSPAAPDPLTGPDPLTAPDPLAAPAPPDPLSAPVAPVGGPSWPCGQCGTVNPMARDTCSDCGMHFLAGLREQDGPLLDLPVVGDITRLSRGSRFALAGGVILAFVLLTFLIGLLFG